MVKKGRLYIAAPPLFSWGDNPKNYGWTKDITRIPSNVKTFKHYKGLGEMNNPEIDYFLVNPQTRNLYEVEYPSDLAAFNKILGTSEGKNELLRDLGVIVNG